MRIAVVSDVHGSLAALEAVVAELDREAPDLVVHGGDLALNGPSPAEVVDLVRERGWPGVIGNTDELLGAPQALEDMIARSPQLSDLLGVLRETAAATRERLGQERIEWLMSLPRTWRHDRSVLVLHASPGDLWRAPGPDASDDELIETYGEQEAAVVVYGHIHHPYVRQLGDLTLANSGSVGMSFDGDPRATYLLIEDGRVTVKRVDYDVERDAAKLLTSGYPRADWLTEVRRQGKYLPIPS